MDANQRKQASERILSDPIFNEAWDALEEEIMVNWRNSNDIDIETRERLWLSLKYLNHLKNHFRSIVTTGKMERSL